MAYFVYLIVTKVGSKFISYVGSTNNVQKRVDLHNNSKGAKFTKGFKWIVIYKKKFKDRKSAMSYEYKLKNDKKKRLNLYNKSL